MGANQSYALYYYHNNVSQIVEKVYGGDPLNPLIKTTNFTYKSNSDPLLVSKTVTTSDQGILSTSYKYPADLASGTNVYQKMLTKFIVSPVVEEASAKNASSLITSTHSFAEFPPGNI